MGADIRLTWPGCLLCMGGLRSEADARVLLRSAEAERVLITTPRDWTRERAGSLTSLNATAAGTLVQMIRDFVSGVLAHPTWCRLEWGTNGRLRVTYPRPAQPPTRCLCQFAGLGDAGISEVSKWLSEANQSPLPA